MEAGAPPRLMYNADDGSVIVEVAGPVITVEGIVGELVFGRLTAEGEMASPLWMSQQEARVLANMIGYILKQIDGGQLQIRPESDSTLRALQPRAEALAAALESGDG